MDGPPADIWYIPHAQTRCLLLLVTSEATNFGKVLRFQHLIRTPVRAFTVVFRRFLGRNIKRRKIKNRHFSGRKTKFGRPLIYNNIPIFAKFGTMTHNGPLNWSGSLKFVTKMANGRHCEKWIIGHRTISINAKACSCQKCHTPSRQN